MKTEHLTISNNDKIALISNLHTMLAAGIPILETIDSLHDGSKGSVKKLLETLRDDLMQGKHMYNSLAKFPGIFDKVTVNIIKAAEEAGTLDTTLQDLKITIKKEMEFSNQIRSALMYPIFIMLVFVGVLLMILVVVIPKIASVFSRLQVELPLPTKILIFLSNTVLTYTIPLIVGFVVFVVVFLYLYKRHKRVISGILFSLPLLSTLAKQIDLTRFSRSFALLLSAGIPITSALELAQDVVMKKSVEQAIAHSKDAVISGKKLSEGFKYAKNIFPNIMIKIIEAGEKSGSLDSSMQEVSDYLDDQVTNTLKTVTSLLEPIMLVGVGIMVGGMMLSILAPIYGLIGQVGRH